MYEIEFDAAVQDCVQHWRNAGVTSLFIKTYPDGVAWDCSACQQRTECQADDSTCDTDYAMRCLTCSGYPPNHPECSGVSWGQTFVDIPRSMWFMFVTVSTVGYGDVSPTSWQGQIFVCIVIICGLIFLAMPLAIVGSTFGQVWDERQMFKLQRHLRQLLAENGIEPDDAVTAFKKIDESGDGTVGYDEFQMFAEMHSLSLKADELKQVWKALDSDSSGSLTLPEFIEKAFPDLDADGLLAETQEQKKAEKSSTADKKVAAEKAARKERIEMKQLLEDQKSGLQSIEARMTAMETLLTDVLGKLSAAPPSVSGFGGSSGGSGRGLGRTMVRRGSSSLLDDKDAFAERMMAKSKRTSSYSKSKPMSKLATRGRGGRAGSPPRGIKRTGSRTSLAEKLDSPTLSDRSDMEA